MKWFGASWGAPCCEPDGHVSTPAGDICMQCGRPIEPGDVGFMLPLVTRHEPLAAEMRSWHRDCLLASMGLFEALPAIRAAMRIVGDPTNRTITCPCGVTFLSGAANKDLAGRPLCIGCGAAQELPT